LRDVLNSLASIVLDTKLRNGRQSFTAHQNIAFSVVPFSSIWNLHTCKVVGHLPSTVEKHSATTNNSELNIIKI
jgi:hypothetical protein